MDSQYSTDNYNSVKIVIGAIIKSPEMLRLVQITLKLKRCVNIQLKNCRS